MWGYLQLVDLQEILNKYHCSTLVETGTGKGESLSIAAQFPFRKIHTIEIYEPLYFETKQLYEKKPQIKFHLGHSVEVLEKLLPQLDSSPVCFALDAHYPGADYGLLPYHAEKNFCRKRPLQRELEVILNSRIPNKDVFVIDDIQIYRSNTEVILTYLRSTHSAKFLGDNNTVLLRPLRLDD